MKIYETQNYEIFEMHFFNRDVRKTKLLEESMKEHGFIPAYPLHVVRGKDGKLKIKAGHHRFAAARNIGIPVYYVICEDSATIHDLEKATTQWSLQDYLSSWCRVGKQDYIEIRSYCERSGIPLSLAASMFHGNQARAGNYAGAFKRGDFYIRERKHPALVEDITTHMRHCGVDCYNANLLVQAVSKVLYVKEFDATVFKQKVKTHTSMVTRQAGLAEYLRMIEAVYNRSNKDKIPLAFLAETEAKQRNPTHVDYRAEKKRKIEYEKPVDSKPPVPSYLPKKLKTREQDRVYHQQ